MSKISAPQVLLGMLLIILTSSVAYNITNSIVFKTFKVGQCVKMFPFKGIVKITEKKGTEYVISDERIKMVVSYDTLNRHFDICDCPKRYRVNTGKGWKIRR